MRDNRYSLVIIILLLIIFFPLTIYGYIYRSNNKIDDNPNHDMYYKGKVWFYNNSSELLGFYECKSEKCELAKSTIDDKKYNLNYYTDGTKEYINSKDDNYVFIQDGEYVYLFDIKHNKVIQEYLKVNDYNTKIDSPIVIAQNKEEKYGVLYFSNNINLVLPFEYDFISLVNKVNQNNELISNKIVVLQNEKWSLVDNSGKKITSDYNNPITDYTDKYIITFDKLYNIYDYEGNQFVSNLTIQKYIFENKYIGLVSNNKLYIYSDLNNNPLKEYNITSNSSVSLKYENSTLKIYDNNELIDNFS